MKKLYAILLGLALVLGLATISSAAVTLTVTGEFEAVASWNAFDDPVGPPDNDSGWDGLYFDAANLYIDLKGPMGDNATAELKIGVDLYDFYFNVNDVADGDTSVPPDGNPNDYNDYYLFVNLAKLQYNITDNFYAGVTAQQRSDGKWYRFFSHSVDGGEGFEHSVGHIYFDNFVNVYGGFKFDGGQIDLFADLDDDGDPSWYVKGTFAADALAVTGWFADDANDGTIFIGKVKYAFSDVFNATGGVLSNNSNVYLGLWGNVVLEDVANFKAYLEYDVQPFYNNDYWFMATLLLLGDFQPFFEWDESNGISLGWDYYMGASDFWGEYYFDTNEFDLGVDMVF